MSKGGSKTTIDENDPKIVLKKRGKKALKNMLAEIQALLAIINENENITKANPTLLSAIMDLKSTLEAVSSKIDKKGYVINEDISNLTENLNVAAQRMQQAVFLTKTERDIKKQAPTLQEMQARFEHHFRMAMPAKQESLKHEKWQMGNAKYFAKGGMRLITKDGLILKNETRKRTLFDKLTQATKNFYRSTKTKFRQQAKSITTKRITPPPMPPLQAQEAPKVHGYHAQQAIAVELQQKFKDKLNKPPREEPQSFEPSRSSVPSSHQSLHRKDSLGPPPTQPPPFPPVEIEAGTDPHHDEAIKELDELFEETVKKDKAVYLSDMGTEDGSDPDHDEALKDLDSLYEETIKKEEDMPEQEKASFEEMFREMERFAVSHDVDKGSEPKTPKREALSRHSITSSFDAKHHSEKVKKTSEKAQDKSVKHKSLPTRK